MAEQGLERKEQEQHAQALSVETAALVEKAKAIQPDLIAAMTALSERETLVKMAESMGPLTVLGGGKKSLVDILTELFKGTPLAKNLPALTTGNGTTPQSPTTRS